MASAEVRNGPVGWLGRWFQLPWPARRAFWNGLAILKFRGQRPDVVSLDHVDTRPVELVPFRHRYPHIPIDGPVVAATIPRDEAHPGKRLFTTLQALVMRVFSPNQPDLPAVSADPLAALEAACTPAHRRLFPPPERTGAGGLAELAVASPYASYLCATDHGFAWDLTELTGFECHPGLVELGATVDFAADGHGGLHPTRIASALGETRPGDPDWDRAVRLATCSLTTHAALVRHFGWLHLTAGPRLEAATRNRLPEHHPVRRLLWPHVYGTHSGNELVTEVLMGRGGDFEGVFSFTHRGMCELFEATTGTFDLARINPAADASHRGADGDDLDTPAHDAWMELFDLTRAHTRRYLAAYYPGDVDIDNDEPLGAWIDDLDRLLPNGVGGVLAATSSLDGVAELLATLIHLATVEHEITGSGLWSYQLWNDRSPCRVAASGAEVPVDVYQRLVNANFNLNVRRTMLLDDSLVALAPDARGATAIQQYQQDLLHLQARYDRTTRRPWRIEPRHLKANINA